MKRIITISIFLVLVTFLFFTISSCTTGKHLQVRSVKDIHQIKGSFNLILYRSYEYDSLMTFALLDINGDGYEFLPYALDSEYKVIQNISEKTAFKKAFDYIRHHHSFNKYQLKEILDMEGNTIGYEIRPLYLPFVYGVGDVLAIDYWLKENGKVKVTIDLSISIKDTLMDGRDNSE